jgi:hypothetical protein
METGCITTTAIALMDKRSNVKVTITPAEMKAAPWPNFDRGRAAFEWAEVLKVLRTGRSSEPTRTTRRASPKEER